MHFRKTVAKHWVYEVVDKFDNVLMLDLLLAIEITFLRTATSIGHSPSSRSTVQEERATFDLNMNLQASWTLSVFLVTEYTNPKPPKPSSSPMSYVSVKTVGREYVDMNVEGEN